MLRAYKPGKSSAVSFCCLFEITPYSGERNQAMENICFILSLAIILNSPCHQTIPISTSCSLPPALPPTPPGPIKFYIYHLYKQEPLKKV